jgi:hypothetical protein
MPVNNQKSGLPTVGSANDIYHLDEVTNLRPAFEVMKQGKSIVVRLSTI